MDCSGERFIPQQADPLDEIAVEHQQRYHSVTDLVRGKIVLDAGSGEGYGVHLMAETAARVVGIDISRDAVEHARATYGRQNLEFQVGSVDALPFEDGTFDVVVSFEVIEHLEPQLQAAFLREAQRVLKREGLLVISTPNKAVYSDDANQHNRYHKKEFYVDEFQSFLSRTFPRVILFGQSWFVSSALQKPVSRRLENLRLSDRARFSPKYVVAVCGSTEFVDKVDISSVVIDQEQKLERLWERIRELQQDVEAKNSWASSLEQDLEGKRERFLELQDEVASKNSWALSLEQHIDSIGKALNYYKGEAEAFDARLTILNAQNQSQLNIIKSREAELALLRTELELIKQSDFWKVASRYWRLRDALLPLGSGRRRFLRRIFSLSKAGVRALVQLIRGKSPWSVDKAPSAPHNRENGSAIARESGSQASRDDLLGNDRPAEFARIEFIREEHPKVSVIIPAFNQWVHTYRCLKSIQQTMAGVACEVILADDGSTDTTVQAEELLIGIDILRDGKNRGFLRNCNWAAGRARARYLYFLNNDTELQPGAIQALVSVLDRDPAAGMVGSKLIFPDGRIQEAGGIIWADATGWNFGRGQDASLPAFNYVKEVDYVSGASFMIRRDLWNEIGGFDDQYVPAYCEDSDLAFEVRKRGFKVVYQPLSVVVHFEGVSHGTNVSQRTKAHQISNTGILKEKWADVLAKHFPNGTNIFQARDRSAGRKSILIIDHYVPHFDRDAGSRTIWSFVQAFLKMGMNVKFMGDNFYPHQPYTEILQQAGVEVLTGPWFADHWPEWLAENGRWLDYVFLSRPHIAPKYLRAVRAHTKARIFYYVHDLHYLRELQLAGLQNDPSLKVRAEKGKTEEQRLMNRMDAIFSCSDIEVGIIRGLCPAVDVLYVPPYSVDVDPEWEFNTSERNGILFVGGFSHPPNGDGVLWFVGEIWPAVQKQLPGVVFNIAGSGPPREILALASDDVKVLGFVSDERLTELYRTSRLVVIPLRYGAGVKGKTVEAMAHGVPVVSTEWGVEGMPGVEEILDPVQHRVPLAEAIICLYNDDFRLREISKRERTYVARHFTLENIQSSFVKATALRKTADVQGNL